MTYFLSTCSRRPAAGLRAFSLAVVFLAMLPLSQGVAQEVDGDSVSEVPGRLSWQSVHEGIRIDASIQALDFDPNSGEAAFREARDVEVSLRFVDQATGEPIASLFPAGWVDFLPAGKGKEVDSCKTKVEAFLGGSLFAVPEIDLNVYYVLALNDDRTINVVDPLFGFGGSKLLAQVTLEARGEDWVQNAIGDRLYVTMPSVDRVAVVNTGTWKIVDTVEVGGSPVEIELQPDERRLWVAAEGARDGVGGSGVSVIDRETSERLAHIETGPGPHKILFDPHRPLAMVSNGRAGSITVIDTQTLKELRTIQIGGQPYSMDWSESASAAVIADSEGRLVVLDPSRDEVRAVAKTKAGLGRLRVAPDGRLAFVVNPKEDTVEIFDAAKNRIVQTASVLDGPDQVVFSNEFAYIRHRGSDQLLMIPLYQVGQEGTPVPVIDTSGGSTPFGQGAAPSPADSIVQAPGSPAVLIANPADKQIYFYKEGMAAPMGNFANYGSEPRAVSVVDRSLREVEPGHYKTTVKLRRPGDYDLAFFVSSPQMFECHGFEVGENPEMNQQRAANRVRVELAEPIQGLPVGTEITLRLRARSPLDGSLIDDLDDLEVMTFLSPGIWKSRGVSRNLGEGLYEIPVQVPEAGVYFLFFQSRSLGMTFNQSSSFTLEAKTADDPALPLPRQENSSLGTTAAQKGDLR